MYARIVWEGPPPKKYSVLPSDRSGGRLFDISPEERQRRDAADAAFIADMEVDAIVLEAVHRPRRQQEAREQTRVVDRAPKVWELLILWLWFILMKNSSLNFVVVVNSYKTYLSIGVYMFEIWYRNIYIMRLISCIYCFVL
jgi:hypothetical protein